MDKIKDNLLNEDIRSRVYGIERLGTMPQVAWRLMQALGDDRATANSLEKIIGSDPALASKTISLANSAFYGLSRKVSTISRAVVVIGFQELRLLAMGAGLTEVFDLSVVPPGLDGRGLWFHCLATAWAAGELAEASGHPSPGEAMTSGLLHDLGKLVLLTHLLDQYRLVHGLVQQGLPLYQAEERLGLEHAAIGFWLAERWGLPGVHAAAIRDHHLPQIGDPFFPSTCLVFLADRVAARLGFGQPGEGPPTDPGLALKTVGLGKAELRALLEKGKRELPAKVEAWESMLF
ncbi:MAG: HDOD domain-containing protein [Pseudomonadota bacterium]